MERDAGVNVAELANHVRFCGFEATGCPQGVVGVSGAMAVGGLASGVPVPGER